VFESRKRHHSGGTMSRHILATLILAPLLAQPALAQEAEAEPEIVVTGRGLDQSAMLSA
jgi:hypothetical protein